MNLKSQLLLLSSILFLLSCQKETSIESTANQLVKGNITVSGKIINAGSQYVELSFQDVIQGEVSYIQKVDTLTGEFTFLIDLFHEQDIELKYQEKNIRLFVKPSDSLFFSFNANQFDSAKHIYNNVNFKGNNAILNTEINQFLLATQTPNFHNDVNGKSVAQYHAELESHLNLELEELNQFIEIQQPTNAFRNWAKNEIIYSLSNSLMHYKAYLMYSGLGRNDSVMKINLFPIQNNEALSSSSFGPHLWHYTTDRYYQSDSITLQLLIDENYVEANKRAFKAVVNNEPEGVLRDIVLFKFMKALYRDSYIDFKNVWNNHKSDFKTVSLINEIENIITEKEDNKDFKTGQLNSLGSSEEFIGNVMEEVIKSSQDSLVYLDLWATWCGPCVRQMPYLLELHDDLKNKPIKIISICFDSDRVRWEKMVKKYQLPGQHYFLDKEQSIVIQNQLKISGFPTYMILKNETFAEENAQSPSEKEQLLKVFDELM